MFGFFRIFFRGMNAERYVDVNIFNISLWLALLKTRCLGAVG
jgi:hypothetical protein